MLELLGTVASLIRGLVTPQKKATSRVCSIIVQAKSGPGHLGKLPFCLRLHCFSLSASRENPNTCSPYPSKHAWSAGGREYISSADRRQSIGRAACDRHIYTTLAAGRSYRTYLLAVPCVYIPIYPGGDLVGSSWEYYCSYHAYHTQECLVYLAPASSGDDAGQPLMETTLFPDRRTLQDLGRVYIDRSHLIPCLFIISI